jgi:hypothetical protein
MSDDKIMCIVNAPRIEIVLVPENQAQREGDEVEDDTLLDAYLMLHLPDGTNVKLKLDPASRKRRRLSSIRLSEGKRRAVRKSSDRALEPKYPMVGTFAACCARAASEST